jgi:hypothetical protein
MNYLRTYTFNPEGEEIIRYRGKVISRQETVYGTTIAKLTTLGFEGTDAGLDYSLFEYLMAWKNDGTDWHFIYSTGISTFDNGTFAVGTDWKEEFNWINKNDLKQMLSYLGMTEVEFEELPFPHKVSDISQYFGVENVFGSSYGSFCIFMDGRNRHAEYHEMELN